MRVYLILASLFVVYLILNGCSTKQNETICLSAPNTKEVSCNTYTKESKTEKPEYERWYLAPEYQHSRLKATEFEGQVTQCLRDFAVIKPGLTRAEIMRKFPMDGGLQTVSPVRFVHPECSLFKVDVSFTFERDHADQGRAIMGKNDKVESISKPYIEYPVMD